MESECAARRLLRDAKEEDETRKAVGCNSYRSSAGGYKDQRR